MSAAENKRLTHKWFEEVWNNRRTDLIDEFVAPECLFHGLGDPPPGPQAFKEFHARYCSAFPDLKITVDQVVAEDDWTAQRFSGTGTHTGEGLGVPPTGNPVTFSGMSFGRWRDGKMVEGYNNVDLTELHRKAGLG